MKTQFTLSVFFLCLKLILCEDDKDVGRNGLDQEKIENAPNGNEKFNAGPIFSSIVSFLPKPGPVTPTPMNETETLHPCDRPCFKDPKTRMNCFYKFKLEPFQVMSPACGNCPNVRQDCFQFGCIAADGIQRMFDSVNKLLPGPSIRVCQGDTIIVDVENQLREETSIHWHGIHQRSTPSMDGTPFVTSCVIPRHSSFRYEFQTPRSGTHFWHSHVGLQRGDGIVGALIVRKEPDCDAARCLFDLDLQEHELLIMDWGQEETTSRFKKQITVQDFQPHNILVNGRGMQRNYFDIEAPRGTPMIPLHEVWIKPNFAYKFRIIFNGVMPCPLEMSIENHTMSVIASDGADLVSITVDSLVLYAGERWDVVVEGNQPIGSYFIKFHGFDACGVPNNSLYQLAILHYEGIPSGSMPQHAIKSWKEAKGPLGGKQLNPYELDPTSPPPYRYVTAGQLSSLKDDDPEIIKKEVADHKFYVSIDFDKVRPGEEPAQVLNYKGILLTPQMNHVSSVMPKWVLLTQPEKIPLVNLCNNQNDMFKVNRNDTKINYAGGKNCQEEFCACTHLLKVKYRSIVEVVLIDTATGIIVSNHPFHLHGHYFRLVGLDRVNSSEIFETVKELDKKNLLQRRRRHAPIKDSVSVPRGGYVILRFRANNPGFWLFHCHVEFHLNMGMSLIFQVGPTAKMKRPKENYSTCEL